jgi:hypothetical protein
VDSMKTRANRRIREWLKDPKFKIITRIPLVCEDFSGCNNLLVYEFLDYEPHSIRQIELEMPSLGRKILVDVGKQKQSE